MKKRLELRLSRLDETMLRSLRHGRAGRRPPLITHELKWSWSRRLQQARRSSMCWLTNMRLNSSRTICSSGTIQLSGQLQSAEVQSGQCLGTTCGRSVAGQADSVQTCVIVSASGGGRLLK